MVARKKVTKTKTSSKKKAAAAPLAASSRSRGSSAKKPLVAKQPQLKQQAAVSSGMFLYTNDAWSLRYFNANDLRCEERELFG